MDSPDAAPSTMPPMGSFASWLGALSLSNAEAAERLLTLSEAQGVMAAVKSMATGRYVYASSGMDVLFERGGNNIVGAGDAELMRQDEASSMRRVEQTVMSQRGLILSEHRVEIAGRRREFSVARMPLGADHVFALWSERTEEKHRETHLQRALVQIEQQQKTLEQLRRELQTGSGRDDTSGLYMKAQFDDQLLREIDLSAREHREFALVMIAMDPVPVALQSEGAEANQRVLEGVGRMLRANIRAMDSACRIGEARFAVLLSGVGLATAHARMEQLRRQCAAQIVVLNGRDLGLSLSLGVASFPHTATRQEELVIASDSAVKEAQRRGGNQVVLASIPFVVPS